MNRPKLYDQTTHLLTTAWERGKLKHRVLHDTPVGLILERWDGWRELFQSIPPNGRQYRHFEGVGFGRNYWEAEALERAAQTGYTIPELARIENTFFRAICPGYVERADTPQGLYHSYRAVMELLREIHTGTGQLEARTPPAGVTKGDTIKGKRPRIRRAMAQSKM